MARRGIDIDTPQVSESLITHQPYDERLQSTAATLQGYGHTRRQGKFG